MDLAFSKQVTGFPIILNSCGTFIYTAPDLHLGCWARYHRCVVSCLLAYRGQRVVLEPLLVCMIAGCVAANESKNRCPRLASLIAEPCAARVGES